MADQFYEPAPGELVACDDGLHFILLDEANAHCNWVMRRHPDGGLVSVRKATEHELAHAKARQHLRAGVAQLEQSAGHLPGQQATEAEEPDLVAYHCVDRYGQKKVLLPGAEGIRRHILNGSVLKQLTYMDTACRLLDERDAGLAREAELREDIAIFKNSISALGEATKKLCFNARTVTDGPDQALMDACEAVEKVVTLPGIARAMDYVESLRTENAQLSEKYEAARDRKNSIKLLQERLAEATDLLKHMTCSYHLALENGYDRIVFLGGDCDSVSKMEADDPYYAKARAFLASAGRASVKKTCPEATAQLNGGAPVTPHP